jgi:hypothetical protein
MFGGNGSVVTVKRANNQSDTTSARTLGFIAENIATGAQGYVVQQGILTGVDTTGLTAGDTLYLGNTDGDWTTTKPYGLNHMVYVGVVIKVGTGGEIFVKVQNGYEIDELHKVFATGPSNGDILVYNSTSGAWFAQANPSITGPTGPTGAAGATGPTGPTGATGNGWEVYQTTGYIYYNGATGFNMAAGYLAMNGTAPNTASGLNVAIGARAMQDLTTGDNNYALGVDALRDITTGSRNVALGFRALGGSDFFGGGVTTGSRNMAIGHYSLGLTTGSKNTAIGENCAFYMTTGEKNTFIGSYSGYNNNGDNNIAIGERAMFGGYFYTSTVTGDHNVAIGQYTLQDLTTGNQNIAIGQNALKSITTTSGDIGIGINALQANITGSANTAIGNDVLYSNTANGNTGIGTQALYSATTGGGNTAIGREAGKDVTTGGGNTLIGSFAGNSGTNDLTTGSNNTIIGQNAAATSATVNNEITIGDTAIETFRIPGIGLTANDNRLKITGHFAGSAPVTVTADHTVADSTYWLINNKSGSALVVTLPTASDWTGRILNIHNYQNQQVNSASSNVVPKGGGSAGTAILTVGSAGAWATIVSDGTNWLILQEG